MFRMANHEVTRGGQVLTKRKEQDFLMILNIIN
jgi:hypothetical protein